MGEAAGDADFDAIYDEATAARLSRSSGRSPAASEASAASRQSWRGRRRSAVNASITGTLITSLALGLQEVFDPPPDDEIVEEIDLDGQPYTERPVHFVQVDGAPRASRIILRPWLAGSAYDLT